MVEVDHQDNRVLSVLDAHLDERHEVEREMTWGETRSGSISRKGFGVCEEEQT
jgi:hypothetical protein